MMEFNVIGERSKVLSTQLIEFISQSLVLIGALPHLIKSLTALGSLLSFDFNIVYSMMGFNVSYEKVIIVIDLYITVSVC